LSREEVGSAVRVDILVIKRELGKMVAALASGTDDDGCIRGRGGHAALPCQRSAAASSPSVVLKLEEIKAKASSFKGSRDT
jgi:hypothetical protein